MKKTNSATAGPANAAGVNNKKPAGQQDLTDSPEDEAKMQEEEVTLDLPEVKDIPGQEHVRVPKMKEFADVTASSDDEEGSGVLDYPEDEDILADRGDTNVSREEANALRDAAEGADDEEDAIVRATALDSTDDDGEPLNEKGFRNGYSGGDLDVPGSEDDDDDEAIGEEDEENNPYSVDEENEDDEK